MARFLVASAYTVPMDLVTAVILGVIQGVTEFLPVSSDGHLVVASLFLGGELDGRDALGFDILLHCGSLIAIVIGFRDVWFRLLRDLLLWKSTAWKLALLLVLGTIPGALAGLFFEDVIAGDLRTLSAAAVGFLITAAFLVAGEWIARKRATYDGPVTIVITILVGIAQALAILPGVSRSGLTVSMGRALGMKREDALNFSFLLALPIITGAVLKNFIDSFDGIVVFPPVHVSVAGFGTSMIVSVIAILFLRRFVRTYSFAWFAIYLIPLAVYVLGFDTGFFR